MSTTGQFVANYRTKIRTSCFGGIYNYLLTSSAEFKDKCFLLHRENYKYVSNNYGVNAMPKLALKQTKVEDNSIGEILRLLK
jgi:hypothetical protein